MRLVCPKCEAEYEVTNKAIAATGRDVQCSDCGHRWFYDGTAAPANSPAQKKAPAMTTATRSKKPSKTARKPAGESAAEDILARPATAKPAGDSPPAATPVEKLVDPGTARNAKPDSETYVQRRTLDTSVIAILREEAAREANARRNDAVLIESQPEFWLSAPQSVIGRELARGTEKSRAIATADSGAEDDELAMILDDSKSAEPRRNVLPDIEQITSTLRATSVRLAPENNPRDDRAALRRRFGFRLGFISALSAALLLMITYLFATPLAARYPSMEPALSEFVATADRGRLGLDMLLGRVTEWMQGAPVE